MTLKLPRRHGFFEHYEELVGTWTRRLRNRSQAEDLAHDTFVRVLESDSAVVQQPRAYLHQTARNIAVDAYRREDRREDRRGAMESEAIDLSVSSSGDPEHYMHAIQLADSIERALTELPINCRKVFVWQKIEGLTQAEIAERLGLSRNMVEKYMIRTLRHLRDRLEGLQ
ncbi:sigma-70 family RNA polymerase sigma factor [Pseudomonas putida]|jgi:RNA polymerase sigma-70 factor (ECF subfamily)|uniref:sigma-70 family RNA polymerase sigma factor n=1 Tax=Pseudomonas putida TaxID=303 RepID=UPI003D98C2D3